MLSVKGIESRKTDSCYFFFFNDTATTEIYTLSLHDALPISGRMAIAGRVKVVHTSSVAGKLEHRWVSRKDLAVRSEEHTSELQSLTNLVCRLLLEKKKKTTDLSTTTNSTHSHTLLPSRICHPHP